MGCWGLFLLSIFFWHSQGMGLRLTAGAVLLPHETLFTGVFFSLFAWPTHFLRSTRLLCVLLIDTTTRSLLNRVLSIGWPTLLLR